MGALLVNLGRESGSHDAPLLFSVSYTSQASPAGIATTLRDPPVVDSVSLAGHGKGLLISRAGTGDVRAGHELEGHPAGAGRPLAIDQSVGLVFGASHGTIWVRDNYVTIGWFKRRLPRSAAVGG